MFQLRVQVIRDHIMFEVADTLDFLSMFIPKEGERPKEQTAESSRKIAEFTVATEEGMVVAAQPLTHPVRKRHQTLNRDRSRPPLFRVPQSSVLQMVPELNEFEP